MSTLENVWLLFCRIWYHGLQTRILLAPGFQGHLLLTSVPAAQSLRPRLGTGRLNHIHPCRPSEKIYSTDRSSEKKLSPSKNDHRTRGPQNQRTGGQWESKQWKLKLFLRKRGSLNCITFLRRIKFFPSASHSLPQIPTCSSSCTSCSSCLSPSCSCHWSSDSQSWQSLNRLNRLKVKITTSSHAPPKAVPTLDLSMTRLFSCGVVVLHLFMQPSGSPPDGSLAELDLKVKSGSSISSSKGRNLAWMHTKY